jgi:hypothetical protein
VNLVQGGEAIPLKALRVTSDFFHVFAVTGRSASAAEPDFRHRPRDPLTLGAMCFLLLLTGLFAAWWPAKRAASTQPMQALRGE